jgi:hypothetical protein
VTNRQVATLLFVTSSMLGLGALGSELIIHSDRLTFIMTSLSTSVLGLSLGVAYLIWKGHLS